VRKDVCENPRDRSVHEFYVIEAPDWINVIPLTANDDVVMIEQYRFGIEEVTLELPGGMVDDGESPRNAAARELLEETGYDAKEILELGATRPNPAIQDNRIHSFLASGAEFRGDPIFHGTEHTIVRLVALEKVPELIANGTISHSLVVVAFHWLSLLREGFLKETS
jgi:8-oxo-dGTP pyrophosphatase MutT (NUDIX family)